MKYAIYMACVALWAKRLCDDEDPRLTKAYICAIFATVSAVYCFIYRDILFSTPTFTSPVIRLVISLFVMYLISDTVAHVIQVCRGQEPMRKDLMFHHAFVLLFFNNYPHCLSALSSIIAEYFCIGSMLGLSNPQNMLFRLGTILFVRYPLWYCHILEFADKMEDVVELNKFGAIVMATLDTYWAKCITSSIYRTINTTVVS